MSDTLTKTVPTPLELRAELLGPAGGPDEVVDEANVCDRYVVGRLALQGAGVTPDEQDNLAVDEADDSEDGQAETGPVQTATFYPFSLGLTFSVDGQTDIQITARWGQYRRAWAEDAPTYKGKAPLVWLCRPVEGVSDAIILQPGLLDPWAPDPDTPDKGL